MKRHHLLAIFGLVLAPALFSQEFRGAISGAVTDGTGAAVAGARVRILESSTWMRVDTVTDSTGHYSAPFLLPGDYDISVKLDGFTENIPQIRGEGFNIVNHAVFGPANTTATNATFGIITSQANRPRLLQVVARIVF